MITKYSISQSVAAMLVIGCASAPSQHPYVAPNQETVFTTTEETSSGPGHIIYAENRSSVPVLVYSFTLRECENVKQQCTPRTLNLHLDPNSRATLSRVEPANPDKAFSFRFTFGWRADSATTAALGALASVGAPGAGERLTAIQQAESRRMHEVGAQDLELTAAELASLADRATMIRPLPDSLVLRVGARVPLDTVRAYLIGTNGETLGRVRGLQWRLIPGPVEIIKPDTLVARAVGRTSMQLKLPDDVVPTKVALHALLQVPVVVRP
jgi:hypothetical protein